MDTTKNQLVERIRQRFQNYKDRHNDALSRFVNNMPVQNARDRTTDEMLLKAQQTNKPKPNKQFEMIRRMSNQGNDQASNHANMNGVFNNNEIVQQAQKRSFATFSGSGTATGDDPLQKMSRISDVNKQFPMQGNMQNTMQNNMQNNVYNKVPNVNPFQKTNESNKLPTTTAVSKSLSTTSALINPSLSLSDTMIGNSSVNTSDTMLSNVKPIKSEVSLVNSCSVSTMSSTSVAQPKIESNPNSFNQFNNDPLAGLAEFQNYKLYGEVASNNSGNAKNVKVKMENANNLDFKNSTGVNSTQNISQSDDKTWITEQKINNLQNNMPNATSDISKMQNPLENLNRMTSRQSMQNQIKGETVGQQQQPQQQRQHLQQSQQQQLTQPQQQQTQQQHSVPPQQQQPQNIQSQQMQQQRSQSEQLQQQQMNSARPVNMNTMLGAKMNQQNMKNVATVKPNMPQHTNNTASSPHSMMQSPKHSLQSPSNFQQTSMNSMSPISSANMPPIQGSMPPTLPRLPMSNTRQHLADHINKHQQPMSNLPNMNNPYLGNHAGSTTNEKLQEHLLKRREQSKMQQMQHQMTKNPFMSSQHMMSPIGNPMQQNPFQFTTDFQSYNQQQSMGMQPQQNSMGFYSGPYQMDQVQGGQMFPSTAPPGYNQTNRAAGILQNLMRDRQQMSDMYNSTIGNMRPQMDQNGMFYSGSKAPPQYPNQGMSNLEQQQQMMMNSNANISGSRLSHFSQPNNSMGMPVAPGMNPAQVRMRMPMSNMNRYPAPPSLSRSMSMPGGENLNMGDTTQFNNFNMTQRNQAMMNMNPSPNFPGNYTNEALLYLQKRRTLQQQQQRQQQMLSMQQRQNQQQQQQQQPSMMQPQHFNTMMNNPGHIMQDSTKHLNNSMSAMNSNMNENMNLNAGNSLFQQQQQNQQQQQTNSFSQQQHGNNVLQQSTDLIGQSSAMAQQPNTMVQQSNTMVQQSNAMGQQSSAMMQQPSANRQSQPTPLLQQHNLKDQTSVSTVDSNKNLLSTRDQNQTQTNQSQSNQSVNFEQPSTDEADDIDSLLNDPPEHFDLVKIFS